MQLQLIQTEHITELVSNSFYCRSFSAVERVAVTGVLSLVFAFASTAHANGEDFLSEAPAAWAEYRDLVRNSSNVLFRREVTLKKSGELRRNVESTMRVGFRKGEVLLDELYSDGGRAFREVAASNSEYSFVLRADEGDPLQVTHIGKPDSSVAAGKLTESYYAADLPFYLGFQPLTEYIEKENFVELASSVVDNTGYVRIEFSTRETLGGSGRFHSINTGYMVLDPARYWIILEYEGECFGKYDRISGTHEYSSTDPPLLLRRNLTLASDERQMDWSDAAESVSTDSPPKEHFRLSSYGFSEPGQLVSDDEQSWWWVTINITIIAVLSWLWMRRKRAV